MFANPLCSSTPVIALLCLASALLAPFPLCAGPAPVSIDSKLYYEIGGADSITAAPNPRAALKTYRAATSLGLGYSCGKFDKTLGVARLINDLQNTGNSLVDGAISAVTAAIGSLPMLILQRVNPGLYDLFQGLLIRAEAVIQIANTSCEEIERTGKLPFEDFAVQAKFNDWKAQMGNGGFSTSSVDADLARENVEKNNGANGVPWVGGVNAGGKGQQPVRSTFDVVIAGYNITLNRAPTDTSSPSDNPDITPVVKIWGDPQKAGNWAVNVLGEALIRTHDGRDTETTPGFGLLKEVQKEQSTVVTELNTLVATSQPADLDRLNKTATAGTLITADVLRTLRDLTAADQTLAVNKLAAEVAMTRVMEKAITLRRLLLTGKREPNIAASSAPLFVNESVETLEREIDGILFEKRVRRELFASTSAALLGLQSRKGTGARPELLQPDESRKPVRDSGLEN